MSLDVLELEMAHLFVWSESGYVIVEVERDESYFKEKRGRLIAFHRNVLLPEHFTRRALHYLPPLEVLYEPFHEDPDDPYFLEHGCFRFDTESRYSNCPWIYIMPPY